MRVPVQANYIINYALPVPRPVSALILSLVVHDRSKFREALRVKEGVASRVSPHTDFEARSHHAVLAFCAKKVEKS